MRSQKQRIASKTTTVFSKVDSLVSQIVVVCSNAGTAWTISFQDKAGTPSIITASLTLTVPTDGKPNLLLNFDEPIFAEGGVEAVTGGTTAGVLTAWVNQQPVQSQ